MSFLQFLRGRREEECEGGYFEEGRPQLQFRKSTKLDSAESSTKFSRTGVKTWTYLAKTTDKDKEG